MLILVRKIWPKIHHGDPWLLNGSDFFYCYTVFVSGNFSVTVFFNLHKRAIITCLKSETAMIEIKKSNEYRKLQIAYEYACL